ncbi:MAG: hypothetical protein K8T89_00345 [Planctomycetes bacterium]|nr:hypothetical protein [Planctomycetota bacterium]
MPSALSDPSPTLFVFVIIIVALLGLFWLRSKKTGDLVRFLAGAGALLALFLIDRFVESPREQMVRKVEEMAKSSQDKKWEDVFLHVSDSFKYKTMAGGEIDKKVLREKVKQADSIPEFSGFGVSNLHRAEFRPIDDKNAKIGFSARVKHIEHWIIAVFTKDADGQWRMSEFTAYPPDKQDRAARVGIMGLD